MKKISLSNNDIANSAHVIGKQKDIIEKAFSFNGGSEEEHQMIKEDPYSSDSF